MWSLLGMSVGATTGAGILCGRLGWSVASCGRLWWVVTGSAATEQLIGV